MISFRRFRRPRWFPRRLNAANPLACDTHFAVGWKAGTIRPRAVSHQLAELYPDETGSSEHFIDRVHDSKACDAPRIARLVDQPACPLSLLLFFPDQADRLVPLAGVAALLIRRVERDGIAGIAEKAQGAG